MQKQINEVTITASGPVGCAKSALLGEIEIMLKAMGVPVRYANEAEAQAEKNGTHADWTSSIEMYRPSVVLVEEIKKPAASSERAPAEPLCDTCLGHGMIYAGSSGLDSDGNAPLTERCPECGYGDEAPTAPPVGSIGDDPEFLGRVIAAASAVMGGDASGEWERFVAYIDSRAAAITAQPGSAK